MKAAIYTEQGLASEVLRIQVMEDLMPLENEVQIEIHYSGVNPGEVKKRADTFGVGMPYEKIIPHSDGSGYVRSVGSLVDEKWIGKKVLCFGAQSYRQFGTAAEYCCVPVSNVYEVAEHVDLKQAAQMGIPGITAHRAIHVGGCEVRQDRTNQVVLIQGGSGAVGQCVIAMAKKSGAVVLATVRKEKDLQIATLAGADQVFLANEKLKEDVLTAYPEGVDHIVEVAFASNIETDVAILKLGGTIATYASDQSPASVPFWPLVFSNISIYFLGSDDFSEASKQAAVEDLAEALAEGWQGLAIGEIYDLVDIDQAHLHIENRKEGRSLVKVR
ncbi:NADPH:quinone reductase [uncultured Eudoraea sp.]|uniref:NADPH:quinone reductase n=1 Tax=uncultured Eudoraea sp. TaxID=1035614 RepID=UPI0026371671|nr:NADPH:quinone reductase [uncultured Eudoraea sp.]